MANLSTKIEIIEGIGASRAAALAAIGISRLGDLIRASSSQVATALSVASLVVDNWKAASWLLIVKDMDENVAEALVSSGIVSINGLADAGLQTLERAVADAVSGGLIQDAPTIYGLAELQRNAGLLRNKGFVFLELMSAEGNVGLPGIEVVVAGKSTASDDNGLAILQGVEVGDHKLQLYHQGLRLTAMTIKVRANRIANIRRIQIPEHALRWQPKVIDEFLGNPILSARACRWTFQETQLAELPNTTYVVCRSIETSMPTRLDHIYRRKVGNRIEVDYVKVDSSLLPAGASARSVIQLLDGKLVLTKLSVLQVRGKSWSKFFKTEEPKRRLIGHPSQAVKREE